MAGWSDPTAEPERSQCLFLHKGVRVFLTYGGCTARDQLDCPCWPLSTTKSTDNGQVSTRTRPPQNGRSQQAAQHQIWSGDLVSRFPKSQLSICRYAGQAWSSEAQPMIQRMCCWYLGTRYHSWSPCSTGPGWFNRQVVKMFCLMGALTVYMLFLLCKIKSMFNLDI